MANRKGKTRLKNACHYNIIGGVEPQMRAEIDLPWGQNKLFESNMGKLRITFAG